MRRAVSYCDCMNDLKCGMDKVEDFGFLYVGSYFCDVYFLTLDDELWKEASQVALSCKAELVLVLPIPSALREDALKEKALMLIDTYSIEEVVVNNYALYQWLSSERRTLRIWFGRLLSKDIRDPRYEMKPKTAKLYERACSGNVLGMQPYGIEIDMTEPIHSIVDTNNCRLAVHYPLAYLSTGRLCELSGIGMPIEKKFSLIYPCAQQCQMHWIEYENRGIRYAKHGRGVYTDNAHIKEMIEQTGARMIETQLLRRKD